MNRKIDDGISIIICCYNSSWVIERTLDYISKQEISKSISWELILVNNASTDNTEIVSRIFLEKNIFFKNKYKIVYEATPGLIYARNRGINESRYEYLLYCDDDNLLSKDYLKKVYEIMTSNENIAACGGKGVALIEEGKEPIWFKKYEDAYAIGTQIGENIVKLYGAGMCVRRSALIELDKHDFKSFLTGRKGSSLLAGEDAELTIAMKIIGYDLYASDALKFLHVIPENRLTTEYLLKLQFGFGMSTPILYYYIKYARKKIKNRSILSHFSNYFTFSLKQILLYLQKQIFGNKLDKKVRFYYLKGFLYATYLLRKDIINCRSTLKRLGRFTK